MQGLKRDEIDKVHEIKRKESSWAKKMTVRDGYNKQIVSNTKHLRMNFEKTFFICFI